MRRAVWNGSAGSSGVTPKLAPSTAVATVAGSPPSLTTWSVNAIWRASDWNTACRSEDRLVSTVTLNADGVPVTRASRSPVRTCSSPAAWSTVVTVMDWPRLSPIAATWAESAPADGVRPTRLPESLPADRRRPFVLREANPVTALRGLAELHGIGSLVFAIALASLTQFIVHSSWVLFTTFKFGWGPTENGWSLFAIGVMSVLTQGFLLKPMLRRWSAQQLVIAGFASSALFFTLYGAVPSGTLLYVVLFGNVFGYAMSAALQSLFSNAAGADAQGRTAGAVASLNSLMAVLAPVVSAPLLATVSHAPPGDWRIGMPLYVCGMLQLVGLVIAWRHFRRARAAAPAAASPGADLRTEIRSVADHA